MILLFRSSCWDFWLRVVPWNLCLGGRCRPDVWLGGVPETLWSLELVRRVPLSLSPLCRERLQAQVLAPAFWPVTVVVVRFLCRWPDEGFSFPSFLSFCTAAPAVLRTNPGRYTHWVPALGHAGLSSFFHNLYCC